VTVTIDAATRNGLHRFNEHGNEIATEFDGRDVSSLAPAGDERWAIVDRREVWHDGGDGWRSVAALDELRATRIVVVYDDAYIGTSEAHLYRARGDRLERVEAFDHVEGRDDWYTPWGGPPDVRSMADWDEDVYVNVHVGGIPRTDDRGATWHPTIDIDADVHHVTTAQGLVIAACAGGVAISRDRGATWTYRIDGLDQRYSRGVAVCGDVLLASTSRGPRGGDAAVYRGALRDGSFDRCRAGLPEAFDGNIDTYRLDALRLGAVAAFGTEDGRAFITQDAGETWSHLADGLGEVRRELVLP
jgi:hypothetical protein